MQTLSRHIPVESLISRQIELWRQKQCRPQNHEAFPGNLTISRDFGGRGNELAARMAEKTGWKVYDREIVDYIAQNAHVRKAIVESFDEKTRRELEVMLSNLLNANNFSRESYLKYLVKTILSIGAHGRAIFLGRGANFILSDSQALKVRVVESMADRKRHGSADSVEKRDMERAAYINRLFGAHIHQLSHYHLALNLSKMDMEMATETLLVLLRAKFGKRSLDTKKTQTSS